MSNQAVLKCTQCGRPVILSHLSTTEPDEDLTVLHQLMKDTANNVICPNCQRRNNYATQQRNKGFQQDFTLRPLARDDFPYEWALFERMQAEKRRRMQWLSR